MTVVLPSGLITSRISVASALILSVGFFCRPVQNAVAFDVTLHRFARYDSLLEVERPVVWTLSCLSSATMFAIVLWKTRPVDSVDASKTWRSACLPVGGLVIRGLSTPNRETWGRLPLRCIFACHTQFPGKPSSSLKPSSHPAMSPPYMSP